ncbi:hypothetical protein E2C01_080665 [Portunus trituberculatus]|uniref:Uncharacterized protein n=1 Tax=Portunus trituberculatus TaxID=210409 RepID=A0A5B7IW01_PORTR|nr:hypothetical protein [Portunus trituberculatus]
MNFLLATVTYSRKIMRIVGMEMPC